MASDNNLFLVVKVVDKATGAKSLVGVTSALGDAALLIGKDHPDFKDANINFVGEREEFGALRQLFNLPFDDTYLIYKVQAGAVLDPLLTK
ncbi:hypothetical protein CS006_07660 [Bifidobacterium primatium]|uniref:Uncharacterized protein n=2 Tax=Bifidobacterium TaxID=1678 RepID=A0A2M9H8G7_9BIFI|nr:MULTISPECIES: hypothetical protein [Bifidobacterium]NEG96099.1 hypothetical protein [Bifidobacterium sp. SMB2]NEH10823.1 hypothetical protein [Bifidobacterium saimiriisciurei]PJM73105.1 hypothetical protein CS006_07660 [Bifidobacterium primatium]